MNLIRNVNYADKAWQTRPALNRAMRICSLAHTPIANTHDPSTVQLFDLEPHTFQTPSVQIQVTIIHG